MKDALKFWCLYLTNRSFRVWLHRNEAQRFVDEIYNMQLDMHRYTYYKSHKEL